MARVVNQDCVKWGMGDFFGWLMVQSVAPAESKFSSLELESVSAVIPSTLPEILNW